MYRGIHLKNVCSYGVSTFLQRIQDNCLQINKKKCLFYTKQSCVDKTSRCRYARSEMRFQDTFLQSRSFDVHHEIIRYNNCVVSWLHFLLSYIHIIIYFFRIYVMFNVAIFDHFDIYCRMFNSLSIISQYNVLFTSLYHFLNLNYNNSIDTVTNFTHLFWIILMYFVNFTFVLNNLYLNWICFICAVSKGLIIVGCYQMIIGFILT